ncbi:hypothetical protein [Anabaenopsis arnoldii]|uniref:Uncharacterized protein n=1 Tax=Anabaenopsis arnoldii TaxID=2152938 RepID=A0ABT5AVZ9_9CYAN|nr:hypothetical protein [Anabaenopsis arnoldii]MDB9541499.1 hypothetical protein [Anabaenopsis arnoldii]MDH6090478.1 hypothetical protein [Anabaenopsis arnoldii]
MANATLSLSTPLTDHRQQLIPSRIYPTLAIRQGFITPGSQCSKLLQFHQRSHWRFVSQQSCSKIPDFLNNWHNLI